MLTFLEKKYRLYNKTTFIASDPISIPHQFTLLQDIEISGFLIATISWGQRKTILKNGNELMERMGYEPFHFIQNFTTSDLKAFDNFVHRTFNSTDLKFFLRSLKKLYAEHSSMEDVISENLTKYDDNLAQAISSWRSYFLKGVKEQRVKKHFSDPLAGSAAKRINMFLRWMVRKDEFGVDFGRWQNIRPDQLICPLDIHSGRVARKLNLLTRSQNDWKAAVELTENLKTFDPKDPVKYDFALFGLGVFEKF